MSSRLIKFGLFDGSIRGIPHDYPDVWAEETTAGTDRLVIAPASRHIELIRVLTRAMPEPFWLLYVLVVSRTGREPGRYESPSPISRSELEAFVGRFESFLESDGRHHLWVGSLGESDLIVYDAHNVIYAYGRLDIFKKVLASRALVGVPRVEIPARHTHNYNRECDADEEGLLAHLDWKWSPLREQDEE